MEVLIEEMSGGAVVAGRIVLRGNRSNKEVAHLSMTRAEWDDFLRCLASAGRVRQGRILFNPVGGGPDTPLPSPPA